MKSSLYGRTLGNENGLSGLDLDVGSILEAGENLVPDGVQKAGQDLIDTFTKPAEDAVRELAGEKALTFVQGQAQQGIDAVRSATGLSPAGSNAPPATLPGSTTGAPPSETQAAAGAAGVVAAKSLTPWGVGGAVVGGGITYMATGQMKRPPSVGRRIAASALVGIATGIVAGMIAAK